MNTSSKSSLGLGLFYFEHRCFHILFFGPCYLFLRDLLCVYRKVSFFNIALLFCSNKLAPGVGALDKT
jgi:hypothetical protein